MAPSRSTRALCRRDGRGPRRGRGACGRGLRRTAGSGLIEACGVDAERGVCISINTAGKALGVSGAFVAGPAWAIDVPRPARPAVRLLDGAAAGGRRRPRGEPDDRRASPSAAQRLQRARRASARNAWRRPASRSRAGTSHIVPVVIGDNERAVAVARALQARRVRRARHPPAERAARHRAPSRLGQRRPDRGDARPLRRRARRRVKETGSLLRGLFVTGTDTGVGKTVASAALMRRYRDARDVGRAAPLLEADSDRHRAGR